MKKVIISKAVDLCNCAGGIGPDIWCDYIIFFTDDEF
jgi:hypothetical protein